MIPREEWLEPEEWQALGDSEVHVYKGLADSCGLDMDDSRNWRALDFLYRAHVDSVWKLPIEIPKRAQPLRRRIRIVIPMQDANRRRRLQTLQAVKAAWHELRSPDNPKPSAKEVARRASAFLGRPVSPRTATRRIGELRKSGDIL